MKKRVFLSSIMMIVLCAVMITGATFALFTSESETNITIQSGKVEVVSKVESLELYSMGELQQDSFENGGTASFVDNAITLENITPGDKVVAKISIENKSNVKIKYSISYTAEGELEPALVYSVASANASLEFGKKYALEAGADIEDLTVSIELPVDAGNEYQEKEATISILIEAIQGNAPEVSTWDGTVDTSWFDNADPAQTTYELKSSAEFAGLADLVDAGETFEGKTIVLTSDLDFEAYDENGERISFDPIGYGYDVVFKGTFDGQGHTIKNVYQDGDDLGLAKSTAGGGLFASVVDAQFKNINLDGVYVVMNCIDMGTLVGYSYGTCSYENITVSNATVGNYQRYTGGLVGEVNGKQTFTNITIDETVHVGSLWGDFDASVGGIIGGKWGDAEVLLKDCTIACTLEVVNDCTSAYEWHAYRRAGMLIGNTEEATSSQGGVATASFLTCENVTVIYDDWANLMYCKFSNDNNPNKNYPWVKVQAGLQAGTYYNVRYGNPTDANGNKVVDENHVHAAGDPHHELKVFDQLYGGGQGVYGCPTHAGVNVIYNNK